MFGFLLTLPDCTVVPGVIFDDGKVYAHEPIADLYDSKDDVLRDYPDASFQMIGPVVATDMARELVEQDRARALTLLEEHKELVESEYRNALRIIDQREGKAAQ